MGGRPDRRRKGLRLLASLFIGGPDAESILDDLDELLARDLRRGVPRWRAQLRYLVHAAASAASVWRARMRAPRIARVSWLDLKLGVRMLLKYPGLTMVGTLAMLWVIALAVTMSWFRGNMLTPSLPMDEGGRVIAIQNLDARYGQPFHWSTLALLESDEGLETIERLGAYAPLPQHLITEDGRGTPVHGVRISASAFEIARVAPLLGRPLQEADERVGSPPVAVIGYELWQRRFEGDPDVVGQTVRVGATPTEVVGVMPRGFAFPIHEELWVPLGAGAPDYARLGRPDYNLFGRLRGRVSMAAAGAELSAVGERLTVESPDGLRGVRLAVVPFTDMWHWGTGWSVPTVQWFLYVILLAASANLGILVFARTATREDEIAMRAALGASRGRIVLQLFSEAVALVSVSAVVVLSLANWGIGELHEVFGRLGMRFPFWWTTGISISTGVRVAGLTLLAALIIGVVPALRVTGSNIAARVGRSVGAGSGLRFGNVARAVIVGQVAVSLVLLTLARDRLDDLIGSVEATDGRSTLQAHDFLLTRLYQDGSSGTSLSDEEAGSEFLQRYHRTRAELARRLSAEPRVSAVTFTGTPPVGPTRERRIEVEGATLPLGPGSGYRIRGARVDSDFFAVMGGSIIAGRGLDAPMSGEIGDPPMAVVDEAFVRALFGDRTAVGRRVRYVGPGDEDAGPWVQIVGVVSDMGLDPGDPDPLPALYEHLEPNSYGLWMIVRVHENPADFAPELRRLSTGLDPTLRLERLATMDRAADDAWLTMRVGSVGLTLFGLTALALCLAGIYALMSFIVASRRREIGIRRALGAHPRRVILSVFARALLQLGLGVAGGIVLVVATAGADATETAGSLATMAAAMTVMGLLACALPTLRALRIEPTEALREL